ncbi:MAG: alpha/beta hydrolase [Gammaproteobacteria bacterium]|nr:alpha/beta hydrolase [Gammaproteobacteria bacterium]
MSPTTLQQHYVTLPNGQQLHYRCGGHGPPVLLLHPSPQSSTFSLPMAERLSRKFTVIALDTPGYGLSDPLPGNPTQPELVDYLPILKDFLDELGLQSIAIYGNATGAEIAQLFAHAYPERVALCMLDTAGHKEDADLDLMLADYFPNVTPRRDGGHLLTHWDMVRSLSLFSPWQKTDAAHRLSINVPSPQEIHAKMLDYLRVGDRYAAAYRPAFYTAKHDLISRVKVPATLMRWEGKPDLSEVDELITRGLPKNFTILHAGPSVEERQRVNEEYLLQHYLTQTASVKISNQSSLRSEVKNKLERKFLAVPNGQLHARVNYSGPGRVILAIHGASGSSASLHDWLTPLVGQRPIIAIDLPGFGESRHLITNKHLTIESLAAQIIPLIDSLKITEFEIFGFEMGAMVGLELAQLSYGRAQYLWSAGVPKLDNATRKLWQENYAPSIEPRWDGSHLVTAWAIVRDMQLFYPWFDRRSSAIILGDAAIDACSVDKKVTELLKIGGLWPTAISAMLSYTFEEKLAASKIPHTTLPVDQNQLKLKEMLTRSATTGLGGTS